MIGFIDGFLRLLGLRPIVRPGSMQARNPIAPIPPTMDARSEQTIATLDYHVQPLFRAFCKAAKAEAAKHGCDYVAISGLRDWSAQERLYAQGRTAPGKIVTKARPGHSWHNFGLACDFGVFMAGKYLDDTDPKLAHRVHAACGSIAADYGLDWGGSWPNFPDTPHSQAVPKGYTLAEARDRRARNLPTWPDK